MDAMRWSRVIAAGVLSTAMAASSPLLLPAACMAQTQGAPRGQRLILKDGSYQLVERYEIKGDRVRYLSTEREDWEEIPYAMIDWPATKKWNDAHRPGAASSSQEHGVESASDAAASNQGEQNAAAIDKAERAQRQQQMEMQPAVAPGLQLPNSDGVWVLDNFQGVPELLHLVQSRGDVNLDASHNVLRAAIGSFRGAQEPIRLQGQSARVRLHVNDPAIYVAVNNPNEEIEPDSALVVNTHGASAVKDKNQYSSPDSRYVIVRVEVNPGERVIGAMRLRRVGLPTQSEDIVPTTAEILPGRYWMKLTPKEPLTVGEYALMEILGPGQVNLDVWDFAVSPNSPENRHPLTPIKAQPQ